jgi:phosphopantothenate-cysteine ligase
MRVLITAGGTTERIDPVRAIANSATGRLGRLVAERFLREPGVERLFYAAPRRAERPTAGPVEWIETTDTASVEAAVRTVLGHHQIDIIVHAMAISDYRVRTVTTTEQLASAVSLAVVGWGAEGKVGVEAGDGTADLAGVAGDGTADAAGALERGGLAQVVVTPERVAAALAAAPGFDRNDKISSRERDLVLFLEPTPKIISLYPQLAPDAVLVGFKLLADVSYETLLEAAQRVLVDNNCTFVLANDRRDITGEQHVGYLLDRPGGVERFTTKAAIADGIVRAALAARSEG